MINGTKMEKISGNGENRISSSFTVFILSQDIIRLMKSRRMRHARNAPRRREERMHEGNRYLL
jgi:hypothetical protein